jgi:hypothetical protein
MPTDSPSKAVRECAAADAEGRRGHAALARFVVLGLVALSALPATATPLHAGSLNNTDSHGGAEFRLPSEWQRLGNFFAAVTLPGTADARLNSRAPEARPAPAVRNNMTFAAGGKRLAVKLEMTRAEAGNLLLKQIAPN